ncbi:MAG: HAMP domain-containing sensor histidine kinase [Burkholderiales bacterium]
MRTLYLRIYLTVVAVLLVFALVSGFLFQRNIESARAEGQLLWAERLAEWGEFAQLHLPPASANQDAQRAALQDLAERMHVPLALDGADGERIAASERFDRREADANEGRRAGPRIASLPLADGRTLRVLRPGMRHPMGPRGAFGPPFTPPGAFGWLALPGAGLVLTLAVLFVAISIGAYPVVRRLTRRLESLKLGVEAFGAGALDRRVAEDGNDEVASVGASFNRAAARIETLVRSHRSLLANASHELRSPLARMKMALAMVEDAPTAQREALRREIDTNIAELDALVEEVLLASRLDASQALEPQERVELLALAVEEAARFDADVEGVVVAVDGDERLLRRALRNLLENARRYGGGEITVRVQAQGGGAKLSVCDRGPGVPEAARERIFEPFYRLPGHAELAGGVGLGLSLVKQIAERHGGSIRCDARDGGGSCFELSLPSA